MPKIGYQYNPLALTRLFLKLHLENKYDRNEEFPKSKRFALVEFMRTMDDTELETLLHEYVDTEHIEEITFDGGTDGKDCTQIAHYLMKSKRYIDLVFSQQKKGTDGLGVADLINETFTPCDFAYHWETLRDILIKHHDSYGEAFDKIMYRNMNEYAGVSESMLNRYIMENFKFVGSERAPRLED